MRIIRRQYISPNFFALSFNEISSLESIEGILIGYFNEFHIALSPCSFVGSISEMRVSFFAILTDYLGIIELVVNQKALGVLVSVDLNLGKSVVNCRHLVSFSHSRVQPVFKDS